MEFRLANSEELADFLKKTKCCGQLLSNDSDNLYELLDFVQQSLESWTTFRPETQERFEIKLEILQTQLEAIKATSAAEGLYEGRV